MQGEKLNIVRPIFPELREFSAEFDRILKSGAVTNNGVYVQEFERALTQYLEVPTIVFSSGQAALMTMLAVSDVAGGEVICPSFTFCATPHAIKWAGATPVFVDVEQDTLCMNPYLIDEAITENTKAILGVDPYGVCWKPVYPMGGHRSEIKILVDSAASFGSTVELKNTSRGQAQIYSFHATKPFSTMEGGALCSNNPQIIERAKCIRNFGQDENGDCAEPGINGKMQEINALIGLRQLERWPNAEVMRKVYAGLLADGLKDIKGLTVITVSPEQDPIWLYRPILIDEQEFGMSRDKVIEGLFKRGIVTRRYYEPCHLLSAYKSEITLPVTERMSSQVISLPIYSDFKMNEIDRITAALRELSE